MTAQRGANDSDETVQDRRDRPVRSAPVSEPTPAPAPPVLAEIARQPDVLYLLGRPGAISGYAYFAALEIEALAERHSRTAAWRLFRLGAAFKVTGAQGLSRTPLKRDYARRDWQRLARLKGVPFCAMIRLPASFRPRFVTFTGPYRAGLALRSQARDPACLGPGLGHPGAHRDHDAGRTGSLRFLSRRPEE